VVVVIVVVIVEVVEWWKLGGRGVSVVDDIFASHFIHPMYIYILHICMYVCIYVSMYVCI
jgi:hypothetical protein